MEVPVLSYCVNISFDDEISSTHQVKMSVHWQLRNNMEGSINVDTEIFIKFSLSWLSLPFVNVDNIPHLVHSSGSLVNNDVSVFSINISLDIEYLTFFVPDEMILISEHLPPSRVSSCASDIGRGSVSLNVK